MPATAPGGEPARPQADDDVVDADFDGSPGRRQEGLPDAMLGETLILRGRASRTSG